MPPLYHEENKFSSIDTAGGPCFLSHRLHRCDDVAELFFGEFVAGGGNFVKNAAVDPGCIGVGKKNCDALFVSGGEIFTPSWLDVVTLEGGAVPGRLFFDESEGTAVWPVEAHGETAIFGRNVTE